jgi:hypothetical protein
VELPASMVMRFSRDGKLLAWGNPDGTISLGEISTIQSKLTQLGYD